MSSILQNLRKLAHLLYNKIYTLLEAAPPGSLQLTGVLGVAALLVGYYHLRRQGPPTAPSRSRDGTQSDQATSRSSANHPAGSSTKTAPSTSQPAAAANLTPLARAVRTQLQGAKRVTLSMSGVITEEWQAADWHEGATLRSEAAGLVTEIASCVDTYLIAHVDDDVGQAVVTGALEAAGLLGPGQGQVKPHKLLFCSTLEGKVSIVRQLEPDLHVDCHPATIESLRRFMPKLLHVMEPGVTQAAAGAPNVVGTTSLSSYFGSH